MPQIAALMLFFVPAALSAQVPQVQPAPGWCSTAHCDNQMADFNGLINNSSDAWLGAILSGPPGMAQNQAGPGVGSGLGCVSNGTYAACSYKVPLPQTQPALVAYTYTGFSWSDSNLLLDGNTWGSAPIIDTAGDVVIGDDQHLVKFSNTGVPLWTVHSAGGGPVSLVTTPNGAIFAATRQWLNVCMQNRSSAYCALTASIASGNGGSGYSVGDAVNFGDIAYCPNVAGTVSSVYNGAITGLTLNQGIPCTIAPMVTSVDGGTGAKITLLLEVPAPVAVYTENLLGVGRLVSGQGYYLSQDGTLASSPTGPYYSTVNTPCVSTNPYHPNRVYVSTQLSTDPTQGALWALDVEPGNPLQPLTVAWSDPPYFSFVGPSGASPLCVKANGLENIYFDGSGYIDNGIAEPMPTVFGITDNGSSFSGITPSGSALPAGVLATPTHAITCNFALDPRNNGDNVFKGFFYQGQYDGNLYELSLDGGRLEKIDVSSMLETFGAPIANSDYWMRGVFTSYGYIGAGGIFSPNPYLFLSESDFNPTARATCTCGNCPNSGNSNNPTSYLVLLDLTAGNSTSAITWAWQLYPADSQPCEQASDAIEGAVPVVLDDSGNPYLFTTGAQSGAYILSWP
ncbi:MAG TPA: hypothetical protein VN924_01200 [Bryobacteraceae bacterium]|nr:hypothetical protein [Bryobacteraceae bacterium]